MTNALLCKPLNFTVVETGNETTAGPASNLNNDRLARAWRCSGTSNRYVIVDIGFPVFVNTLALLAHNGNTGDTIRFRTADTLGALTGTSPSGPFVSNNLVNALASSHGEFCLHRQSLCLPTSHICRFVRIDVTAVTTAFSAGRLVVGFSMTAADNVDYEWDYRIVDKGTIEQTQNGLDDIRLGAKVMRYSWTWSWLTEAEARGPLLSILSYAGLTKSVLVVLFPDADDLHSVIGFGKIKEEVANVNILNDNYRASFSLQSDLIREI